MGFKSTLLFLTTGALISTQLKPTSNKIFKSGVSAAGLVYLGSIMEFDRLITQQGVGPKRPGYWLIGSGVACAGICAGVSLRCIMKKGSSDNQEEND